VQRSLTNYGTDAGTADAMVVSLTPPLAEYKAGTRAILVKKAANPNTSTTPTIDFGPGAKTIVGRDGDALEAGELAGNGYFSVRYDGTNLRLCAIRRRRRRCRGRGRRAVAQVRVAGDAAQAPLALLCVPQAKRHGVRLPNGVNQIMPLSVDSGHYFSDAGSNLTTGHANGFTCGAKDAGFGCFVARSA
jgi:hypothetical protein